MTNNLGSWCVVSVNGMEAIATILHIGRGKFRIIKHYGTKLANSVIVASDILNCKVEERGLCKCCTSLGSFERPIYGKTTIGCPSNLNYCSKFNRSIIFHSVVGRQ